MSQRTAAFILYLLSAALVAVGIGATLLHDRAPGLFLIAFVLAAFIVTRHLARIELWDTGRLLSGKHGVIRQGLMVPLYIICDMALLCAAWFFTRWVLDMPVTQATVLAYLPLSIMPTFVVLALCKTYHRIWSRAQLRDFLTIIIAVPGGALIGLGIALLSSADEPHLIRFTALFGTLAILPLVTVRLLREAVCGLMLSLERKILMDSPDTMRLLAYGGGLHFRSYNRELTERSGYNDRVVIGIIDDDINLRDRLISGFPVLGTGDEIESISQTNRISRVVITCVMNPEKQAALIARLSRANIAVSIWTCKEADLFTPSPTPNHTP